MVHRNARKGTGQASDSGNAARRLAVALNWQGKGLGSGLLKDGMLRTLQAADIAGIRAIAVHAKDDDARGFYERFGFVPVPMYLYHLFVLIKDVRASFNSR